MHIECAEFLHEKIKRNRACTSNAQSSWLEPHKMRIEILRLIAQMHIENRVRRVTKPYVTGYQLSLTYVT